LVASLIQFKCAKYFCDDFINVGEQVDGETTVYFSKIMCSHKLFPLHSFRLTLSYNHNFKY
jgi:hypothetical protein